jgi:branched-chain amino acid transport system permease protein
MGIFSQLVINSVIAGSVYTLMALGFNLIYGATRFFNLAHGVTAAVGGYAFFALARLLGVNIVLGAVLAVAAAGLSGCAFDRLVYSALRRRKASNMVMLVASLGVFTTTQSVIAVIFTSRFQTLSAEGASGRLYAISGGVVTGTQLATVAVSAAAFAATTALLGLTGFGRAVRAISDDEEVARIVGINTERVIAGVFFIGSALAGAAGILVGLDTGVQPTMGMGLLLKGVIASIIGGVGSVYGGVLGAFLLGFVENFGIWKMPGEWKDAIAFLLLILFLLVRPRGMVRR